MTLRARRSLSNGSTPRHCWLRHASNLLRSTRRCGKSHPAHTKYAIYAGSRLGRNAWPPAPRPSFASAAPRSAVSVAYSEIALCLARRPLCLPSAQDRVRFTANVALLVKQRPPGAQRRSGRRRGRRRDALVNLIHPGEPGSRRPVPSWSLIAAPGLGLIAAQTGARSRHRLEPDRGTDWSPIAAPTGARSRRPAWALSWVIRVNGPTALFRLRCFAPLCPALRKVIFVIVGHPRRI